MRLTIIKGDNAVYLDGVSRNVDCSALPPDFHALQWYGTWGEIEFVTDVSQQPPQRKPNQVIRDLGPYQALIDAWKAPPAPDEPAPVAKLPGGVHVIAS